MNEHTMMMFLEKEFPDMVRQFRRQDFGQELGTCDQCSDTHTKTPYCFDWVPERPTV